MLVSIVILALAALCAAIGIWAVRRSSVPEEVRAPVPAPQAARAPPAAPPLPAATAPTSSSRPDKAMAVLEFDGPMGRVAIDRAEVVIGRHSQDDVRISDVRVSRHHARLVAKRDGRFEIHNLTADRSEPNPMQINGETREHADIADGDVVTLGGVSFIFRQAA